MKTVVRNSSFCYAVTESVTGQLLPSAKHDNAFRNMINSSAKRVVQLECYSITGIPDEIPQTGRDLKQALAYIPPRMYPRLQCSTLCIVQTYKCRNYNFDFISNY
jgi:hypothetical protein